LTRPPNYFFGIFSFKFILVKLLDDGREFGYDIYKPKKIKDFKIMSQSQELLQQLAQALTQVLGGGNGDGLGFCPIPEKVLDKKRKCPKAP
jgi:hypothetical protein